MKKVAERNETRPESTMKTELGLIDEPDCPKTKYFFRDLPRDKEALIEMGRHLGRPCFVYGHKKENPHGQAYIRDLLAEGNVNLLIWPARWNTNLFLRFPIALKRNDSRLRQHSRNEKN